MTKGNATLTDLTHEDWQAFGASMALMFWKSADAMQTLADALRAATVEKEHDV